LTRKEYKEKREEPSLMYPPHREKSSNSETGNSPLIQNFRQPQPLNTMAGGKKCRHWCAEGKPYTRRLGLFLSKRQKTSYLNVKYVVRKMVRLWNGEQRNNVVRGKKKRPGEKMPYNVVCAKMRIGIEGGKEIQISESPKGENYTKGQKERGLRRKQKTKRGGKRGGGL